MGPGVVGQEALLQNLQKEAEVRRFDFINTRSVWIFFAVCSNTISSKGKWEELPYKLSRKVICVTLIAREGSKRCAVGIKLHVMVSDEWKLFPAS